MASEYHNEVIEIIKRFGEKHEKDGELRTIAKGRVTITHLDSPFIKHFDYGPDFRYIRDRDLKNITFQILDSQKKKPKQIFGDILNAILTGTVYVGYFIVPDKETYKKVNDMCRIVDNIFEKILRAPPKNLPLLRVVQIPYIKDIKIIKDELNEKRVDKKTKKIIFEDYVEKILKKRVNQDRWFTFRNGRKPKS